LKHIQITEDLMPPLDCDEEHDGQYEAREAYLERLEADVGDEPATDYWDDWATEDMQWEDE
jgi:hypothetical protein